MTVNNVRASGGNYDVNTQVCARRIRSGFDFAVPVSQSPWSVKAAGKAIEAISKGSTFDETELDKGSCTGGYIPFKASRVTQINYANSRR